MKRTLVSALALGLFSTIGLIGCGEESKVTDTSKATGPGGTTTIQKETSVKTTGDNPPAPSAKP